MNRQREFIDETLHVLAQPITALRATVELGLNTPANAQAARQALSDCLSLIDRLTKDLAVLREIASLDAVPPLGSCCGQTLLQNCVEEMAPVAESRGVALRLVAEPVAMQCNQPMFERAMFVALDELIAATLPGGEVLLSLLKGAEDISLELLPGLRGARHNLCLKLMRAAGGTSTNSVADRTSVSFQEFDYRNFPAIPAASEQALASHESISSLSENEVAIN
jgi:signal transduction histidine kinase